METLSFAFGMLAMVAIILLIVVVVGIVKVYKQGKQITDLERWISDIQRETHERISKETDNTCREFERAFQEIERVQRQEHNHTNEYCRDLHNQIENKYNAVRDLANAYTDARIDKLETKLINKK